MRVEGLWFNRFQLHSLLTQSLPTSISSYSIASYFILFLLESRPFSIPLSRGSGVAPHVTELAAGLERRGHEVHVYSRTGDGQMPYEIIDGVHIHRVPIALDPGLQPFALLHSSRPHSRPPLALTCAPSPPVCFRPSLRRLLGQALSSLFLFALFYFFSPSRELGPEFPPPERRQFPPPERRQA